MLMHEPQTQTPAIQLPKHWQTLALCGAAFFAAHCQAVTVDSTQLSLVPADSASAVFDVLTIAELGGTSTLKGFQEFGFEGLSIGSDQTGGNYRLSFSAPVLSLSFQFLALSAETGGPVESLGSFVTDSSTTASFSSADGSATWNGSTVTPLELDGRGTISFTSLGGFLSLTFSHLQADALNGFIINQIDYTLAPVPEPKSAALLLAGLAAFTALAHRHKHKWRFSATL
jgi:hypothetical protein